MIDSLAIGNNTDTYGDRKGLIPMTATELKKLIDNYKIFYDTVIKNETPEESRQALIRTGVIDENGNIILRHQEEW